MASYKTVLCVGIVLIIALAVASSYPIYKSRLEAVYWGPGAVHLGRGESFVVTVGVSKWSRPANFTFSLSDVPPESTGIHVEMSKRTLYVDQNTSATMTIRITADKEATPGDYTMQLNYESSDGLKGGGPISFKVLYQVAATTTICTTRSTVIKSQGLYPVIYNNWWMIPVSISAIILAHAIIRRKMA